jgi:hypothetical protein
MFLPAGEWTYYPPFQVPIGTVLMNIALHDLQVYVRDEILRAAAADGRTAVELTN